MTRARLETTWKTEKEGYTNIRSFHSLHPRGSSILTVPSQSRDGGKSRLGSPRTLEYVDASDASLLLCLPPHYSTTTSSIHAMSLAQEILSLSQPAAINEAQTAAAANLKAASEKVFALAKSVPDDKEELVEEQEQWLGEWDPALVSTRTIPCESSLTRLLRPASATPYGRRTNTGSRPESKTSSRRK